MKKLTKNEFIEKSKLVHGNKYDYSKVEYVNNRTKVCIICPEHGEFWQVPSSHLQGIGCIQCGYTMMKQKQRDSTKNFIKKAKEVHGDKYDYSKVEYVNRFTKVCIICPEHGEFWQTPSNHLSGHGCDKCGGTATNSLEDFIAKANAIHDNKYDYSKVKYTNNSTKVCIICPEHGEFWQTPDKHLQRKGCPKCKESKMEEECRILLEKHGTKYISEKKFNWLKYRSFLKLDFYLPAQNIAIEYQGEQHFNPVKKFGGVEALKLIQERDRIKKELCEAHGIKIEYITYKENLKERLKEILNYED